MTSTTGKDAVSEERRMVLVGRRYSAIRNSWNEWEQPFDEVVAKMTERREDDTASSAADEIVEVVVVRRAVIKTSVEVSEVTADRSAAPTGEPE